MNESAARRHYRRNHLTNASLEVSSTFGQNVYSASTVYGSASVSVAKDGWKLYDLEQSLKGTGRFGFQREESDEAFRARYDNPTTVKFGFSR